MGDAKRGWTVQEINRLRELYPRSREEVVARTLRRSVESVRRKAAQVFKAPLRRGPWSEEEEARLREAYGALDMPALCLVLNRSAKDVRERVRRLRRETILGPWTAAQTAFLKRVYGHRKDRDLVVCLSRPLAEIRKQATLLCLGKDKAFAGRSTMPRWTAEEIRLLESNYETQENVDIARMLRRTVASVANKASQLGLRKDERILRHLAARNVGIRYTPRQ